MIDRTRIKPDEQECSRCNSGLRHSVCYSNSEPLPVEGYNTHSNIELVKRVEELELKVEEMWERIKQFEAVMSTAFRLTIENHLHRST